MLSTLLLLAVLSVDGPLSVVAGTGKAGDSGDGGPASAATLNQPFDVAFAPDGDLLLSDTGNHKIRRIDAKTKVITTVAGTGAKGFSGDGGPATEAKLDEPYGLAVDAEGNITFADRLNRRVRRVVAKSKTIETVAGDGSKSSSGDGGPAIKAGLVEPNGVALDGKGSLYIADVAGNRVRRVDLKTGLISTFAGDVRSKHFGEGLSPVLASFQGARAVEVSPNGTVWILERQGNILRTISPARFSISTVAGTGKTGGSGDGGLAHDATFNGPKEFCLDPAGNIFIVDTENHAIRRIDGKTGRVSTVAGRADRKKSSGLDGLDRPHGVAVGPDGMIVIGDTNNHQIRPIKAP